MKFSEKLKMLRKHNHLTQEELSKKINVSRKTVSGWENGRSMPDNLTLKIISKEFNIPLNNLENENVTNIFDNSLIGHNKKLSPLISYLLIIQVFLIGLSYLSLFKILHSVVIFAVLMVNTIFIYVNFHKAVFHKTKIIIKKDKKKLHLIIGVINVVIGMTSTIYNLISEYQYDSALSMTTGAIFGTAVHVFIITIATTTVYQYYILSKYLS